MSVWLICQKPASESLIPGYDGIQEIGNTLQQNSGLRRALQGHGYKACIRIYKAYHVRQESHEAI